MADMVLTWILFGGAVGFMANFLEFFTDEQKTLTSVGLGVVGGIVGGALGESLLTMNPSSVYLTPLFYTVLGALVLVMLPMQNKLID